MTPAAIMSAIPGYLLDRKTSTSARAQAVKDLARWLDERGHRPTWQELEDERVRRTGPAPRQRIIRHPHNAAAPIGTTTPPSKENKS
ncbi:MAG: hypothetical protein ABI662_09480 [Dermatophilaceae bacterium]